MKQDTAIQYVAKKYPYTTLMTWEFYKHRHAFWEIIVCISGSAVHFINDIKYQFQAGDIIIMKPGNIHDYKIVPNTGYAHYDFYTTGEDMRVMCDTLAPSLYSTLASNSSPEHFAASPALTDVMEEKLSFLDSIQLQAKFEILTETIYKTVLHLICGLCYEQIQNKSSEIPKWFSTVVSLMSGREHIGDSVAQIVAHTGYSHGHLAKLFKDYTGESLNSYFTKIKMNYAITLLKNKEIKILDVSNYLGYSSLSHFIQIFKAYNGITPKQYRKQLHEL